MSESSTITKSDKYHLVRVDSMGDITHNEYESLADLTTELKKTVVRDALGDTFYSHAFAFVGQQLTIRPGKFPFLSIAPGSPPIPLFDHPEPGQPAEGGCLMV